MKSMATAGLKLVKRAQISMWNNLDFVVIAKFCNLKVHLQSWIESRSNGLGIQDL